VATLKAILIFIVPLAVLLAGFAYFGSRAEFKAIKDRLGGPSFQVGFYDAETMAKRWGTLKGKPGEKDLIPSERIMLVIDLVFPFVFGAALAAGLSIAWWMLGRPFSPAVLLGLVFIGVAADWTENLVQLAQLESPLAVKQTDKFDLSEGWIRLAGLATALKLASLSAAYVLLAWLAWRVHSLP
jgi:hypothetical protein